MDAAQEITIQKINGEKVKAFKGQEMYFEKIGDQKVSRIELYTNGIVIKGEEGAIRVFPFNNIDEYTYKEEE